MSRVKTYAIALLLPAISNSQTKICSVKHDVGKIGLVRSNYPEIGGSNSTNFPFYDCENNLEVPVGSCLFPKNSKITYLDYIWGSIGGIVNGDTLVSSYSFWPYYSIPLSGDPFEFHSHEYPQNIFHHRSTLDPEDTSAISEQDFISVTVDTVTQGINIIPDFFNFRPHIPMGIELENKSYAWSIGYLEDIVMFEWVVRNIGKKQVNSAYVGIEFNAAVGDLFVQDPMLEEQLRDYDELGGFLSKAPSSDECGPVDTFVIVWSADNDGDPVQGQFVERPTLEPNSGNYVISCRNVSAIELIAAPKELIPGSTVSYNWWDSYAVPEYNFGPRHRKNFRDFQTGGLGSPWGDVNQYYVMQNGEIDYDPAYTGKIRQFDPIWMYPNQTAAQDISDGTYLTQFLSVGPLDIQSGAEFSIVFAFLIGEDFHTNPNNLNNLSNGNIDSYYANLDFSDLLLNAKMARFIYDNPGVDTDGDGYFGEFRICVLDSVLDVDSNWIPSVAETTYYKGDGVPDWKVALPPPPPKVWVTPTFRGIHIRFNGSESETSRDIFTRLKDFEGYRIYLSRDERKTSYSLLASYDIENYDKYIWNEQKQPDPGWEILDFPSTIREIRCAYASNCDDSAFDPLYYRPSQPFVHPQFPESLFYWVKHDWNVSEFGVTSDIKKIYPNTKDPRTVPADSLTPNDYTDDGYLKYFEYEYEIENLLPTVTYFVSVTAFDFGWPKSRLEPLETSITDNAQQVYASVVDSAFNGNYKSVVVYPNPYHIDEKYRQRGYEGLGDDLRSNERVRRIHFANLPNKCIIKIFSLDGDLVREIHHDKDPSDPTANHEEWGLISKNGLAVVSGLYYWTVESDDGPTQIGKLAIIL